MRGLHLAGSIHLLGEFAELLRFGLGCSDNGLGLAIGLRIAKAGLLCGALVGVFDLSNALGKIGPLALAVSNHLFDLKANGDALGNREALALFVLGVFTEHDLVEAQRTVTGIFPGPNTQRRECGARLQSAHRPY